MSRPSVITLRQFYSSALGRKVKQRLRAIATGLWPDVAQQHIVGVGYATPLLRALERSKPHSMVALMPTDQGAIYWPVHLDNRSVLGDELIPPFGANTLDRVVLLHALEYVAKPLELLQIYWQLLVPGGRLLLIVPNRRSLWARFSHTPFGRGTPYGFTQLRELLNEAQFALRDTHTALYTPPSNHPVWLKLWGVIERLGRVFFPHLGGVWVIEAEKQIYAAIAQPASSRLRDWIPMPQGATSTAKTF